MRFSLFVTRPFNDQTTFAHDAGVEAVPARRSAVDVANGVAALFGAEAKLLPMHRELWYHSSGRVYEQTGKLTHTLYSCSCDHGAQEALFQAELLARNRQRRLHLLLNRP